MESNKKRQRDENENEENEKKRRKLFEKKQYIFIDVVVNDDINEKKEYINRRYDKQEFKVYDLENKIFLTVSIKFNNWFYIEYDEKNLNVHELAKLKGIIKIEEEANMEQSTFGGFETKTIPRLLKLTILESCKSNNILKQIKGICHLKKTYPRIFEFNIERFTRFVTFYKLSLFKCICIVCNNDGGGELIIENETKPFLIPVQLFSNAAEKIEKKTFQINESFNIIENDKNLMEDDNNNNEKQNILCCWNFNEIPKYNFMKKPLIIYLEELCINFLRCNDSMHCDKQSIQPKDFFYITSKEQKNRFEVLERIFKDVFRQFILFANMISCPLYYLFKPNRKIIFDMIYLSNIKNTNIILDPPIEQSPFSSKAFIMKYETFCSITEEEETIIELDYMSMYPGFYLKEMEKYNKLKPLKQTYHLLWNSKFSEKDPIKKANFKLILNGSGYGAFGISNRKTQFKIRSNIPVAERICQKSRTLLENTINYFIKFSKILYAHTDSLIIKGNKNKILNEVKIWNETLEKSGITYSKLEVKCGTIEKIVFFNQTSRCYIYKDNEGNKKLKKIGLLFNSITIPNIYRSMINDVFLEALDKSSSINEFKNNYFEELKLIELSKKEMIVDLFDLMKMSKIKIEDETKKEICFSVGKISNLNSYFEINMVDALKFGKKKKIEVNKILSMYLSTEFNKYVNSL